MRNQILLCPLYALEHRDDAGFSKSQAGKRQIWKKSCSSQVLVSASLPCQGRVTNWVRWAWALKFYASGHLLLCLLFLEGKLQHVTTRPSKSSIQAGGMPVGKQAWSPAGKSQTVLGRGGGSLILWTCWPQGLWGWKLWKSPFPCHCKI